MDISTQLVQQLRQQTQAGVTACREALSASEGDLGKAVDYLRKKGAIRFAEVQDREAKEGWIQSYVHPNGRVGVLLEMNCQTDFVARTDEFKQVAKDICMHIAGRDPAPRYVSEANIPADILERELNFQRDKALTGGVTAGKPDHIIVKIVEGQMSKWKLDLCLLDQEFVKDPTRTVRSLLEELSAKTGEKIGIRQFARFAIG